MQPRGIKNEPFLFPDEEGPSATGAERESVGSNQFHATAINHYRTASQISFHEGICDNFDAIGAARVHYEKPHGISSHALALQQRFSANRYAIDLNLPPPLMDHLDGISQRINVQTLISRDSERCVENRRMNGEVTSMKGNDAEKGKWLNDIVEDEAQSKEVKLTRLSDIIDMNEGQDRSSWLQIGIGFMPSQEKKDDHLHLKK